MNQWIWAKSTTKFFAGLRIKNRHGIQIGSEFEINNFSVSNN